MATSFAAQAPVARTEKPAPPAVSRPQSPFELMRALTDDMDRMFTDVWHGRRWPFRSLLSAATPDVNWTPSIEVEERNGSLYVRTDLPGLTKDDVKVEVTDDLLTIEGERKQQSETTERGYYRSERSYGRFYRSLALPDGAKADTVKATFKDGVLEITIDVPSRKTPETRRVAIGDV